MSFRLKSCVRLSLQELCLRTAVADIWKRTAALLLDENFRFQLFYSPCKKVDANYGGKVIEVIEGIVKYNVRELMIPHPLKKRMLVLVRPIGTELLNWQRRHESIFNDSCSAFHIPLLDHLYWLPAGQIDFKYTAERLAQLESLDVVQRYQFACTYCLVDYIPDLWGRLSEETRERFYEQFSVSTWRDIQLESYWAYVLKGEESKINSIVSEQFGERLSFNQYAFESLAYKANKIAAKYFLQKLTEKERRIAIFETTQFIMTVARPNAVGITCGTPKEKLTDIICFLVSEMSCSAQAELMVRFPTETLVCYFDWPWQEVLLDVAALVWKFISEDKCCTLVGEINKQIRDSGYYLPELFQQFFKRSPGRFRAHFVRHECEIGGIFPRFFEAEDKETIDEIFGAIDIEDIRTLVSSYPFYEIFDGLMVENKWQLIESCLRKASFSSPGREVLKKTYAAFLASKSGTGILQRKLRLKQLFEFLDEMEKKNSNKKLRRSDGENDQH